MNYAKINNLLGWLCGAIALLVFVLTAEKSTSWWDTGEFIASAYKLEIVHQPGAPFFLLVQNLFSNFAFGDPTKIALWMNIGSGVCSGLTITFLFWTITALARKLMSKDNNPTTLDSLQIFSAGLLGALAFGFSDTFWYSAVETEVYAMSSLSTAIVFWLACKWDIRADQPDANRWLLLIAYVIGLSIGVHLLNLLTIPALAILIYFRKVRTVSFKGISKSFAYGVLILAFILWGIIQYSVKIAAYFDLFFVNNLHLPFGSGILVFIFLLVLCLITGIRYSIKQNKPLLNIALLCVGFIYLGFGSYAMLVIRSQTSISLNNYEPSHAFSFLGYLSREQYQTEPLIKGPNFNAEVVGVESASTYRKEAANYEKVKTNGQYVYNKEVLFPRLYSDKHSQFYQQYLGLKDGESPTFIDQLDFFINYQLGHMYARYFLWNFAGRQDNNPSQGEYSSGNWISGFSALDSWRLPGLDAEDSFLKNNPSRKTYFFIPLVLGLIGLIWQAKRSKRDTLVVGLLFFFTGIAIVIYLNQTPLQPRERDYAYVGSFYAFAIWIGLGLIGLTHFIKSLTKLNPRLLTIGVALLCLLAGPIWMLKENWTDHDRSGRMLTREMAINTLNSCEANAILFTYADNDSFPLWYLQEVEGIRTDVRVINYGYLQSDWYVKQAMTEINQAKKLPLGFSYDQVKKGVRDGIMVMDMGIEGHTDLDRLLDVMLSDDNSNKIQMRDGNFENVLPTRKMQLKIDKDAVVAHGVVPKNWETNIPDFMQWEYKQNYVSRAELSLMSILVNNDWERPIYFSSVSPNSIFMGMDKYLASEGLVYKLMPIEAGQPDDHQSLVNGDQIYSNVMERFQWSPISSLPYFDVDSNFYYQGWILPEVYEKGMASLMSQGKTDMAKDIALRAYEFQPKQVTSMRHSYTNAAVVDTLYKVKEVAKAKSFGTKNLLAIDEQLGQQLAITARVNHGFDITQMQLGLAALERYSRIFAAVGDQKLLAKAKDLEKKYNQAWM